jgi:hypothetical protein
MKTKTTNKQKTNKNKTTTTTTKQCFRINYQYHNGLGGYIDMGLVMDE